MRHFCDDYQILGWQLLECLCQPWKGNVRELNRKWYKYTKESQPTLTIKSLLEDSPYVDYVAFSAYEFREKLRNPIFFIKNSPFYREDQHIEKKFPVLLNDKAIKLKDFNDDQLEDLYKEFWLFCWHFHQDPCLNDNVLTSIAQGTRTLPPWLMDVNGDITQLEEITAATKTQIVNQPNSGQEADEAYLSSEPPPLNSCNMDEISPREYCQTWLTYHIVIRKERQKVIAKKFGISPKTISRWCKQYDIKPLDAHDEEPDAD